MVRFFCDLCGEEMRARFMKGEYYSTKDNKPGTMLIVGMHVRQGDLCEPCARKIAGEGKKTP
jgi:hypothetical protein